MLLSKRTADNDESCDEERKERENYRGVKVCYIYSAMLGVQSETGSLCGVSTEGVQKQSFSPQVLEVRFVRSSNKDKSKIDDVFHTNGARGVWWGCPFECRRRPFVTWSDLSCLH